MDTPISNYPKYKFGCFTPSQSLLSFTVYQLWDWFGDCGIGSASPETLIDCFDILSHSSGVLCYKLKSTLPDKPTIVDIYATFFQDIVLNDPMEHLIYPYHYENYGDKDKTVTVVITHEKSGELYDVMEPVNNITEDDWRKNHMKPETTLYRRTKVHGLRLLAPAKSSIMKSWY